MIAAMPLVVRSVGATLTVLGTLFALQWLARRRMRLPTALGRRRRVLENLETVFLPEGASLHLVRIGAHHFVVGRGAASVTLLCAVADEQPPVVR